MNIPSNLENKKIAYYIHSLKVSGAETIVTNYLVKLKAAGVDVCLIQWQREDTFLLDKVTQAGIPVYSCCPFQGKGKLNTYIGVRRLKSIIKKVRPALLHVHTGLEKFKYINLDIKKIVFTLHSGLDRSLSQGKNHRDMFLKMAADGMQIIALTNGAKEDILALVPNANVQVLPNGFDLERIRSKYIETKEAKRRLGIEENAFVMGHVGRYHPVKNHEKLVDVFAQVLKRRPDARLLLVGAIDENRVEKLKSRVSDLVWQQVMTLGETKEVEACICAMDAFVFPSHNEAFPLTAIEAQALGKNVYISDGVPEAIMCTANCQRIKLSDADDVWAEKILEEKALLENDTKLKIHIDDYDIDSVLDKHLQIYSSLC